ncbi:Na+/H+ antiporter NhaC [Urinicoccus timonensis]|uniref:Na+/H+ antiporter NhaC n=1 Tax=Urinicoccus timonensis TaxID=2024205 RepID=UPI000C0780DA|nr:Na+/H+ antiporter NhaC [Urinicoccus timonensis]
MKKEISVFKSLVPIFFLIVTILLNNLYGNGESMLPLIASICVASFIAIAHGWTWQELEDGIMHSLGLVFQPILILMIIGMIIGSWILSGVVPTIIIYGLELLSPKSFLVATVLVCSFIAVATGSSWTTIGTIGVALVGIGHGLGIPSGMTAGAIVSGAYFGDKMSPLSENTNLGSGILGVNLYEHIRYLLYTSIPSMILALILFALVGAKYSGTSFDQSQVDLIIEGIHSQFVISPWLLLVPLTILVVVLLKVPAIPGLMVSFAVGSLAAIFVQGASLPDVVEAAQFGYLSDSGVEIVDKLLSKGGLDNMMYTVSLIIAAMSFGGLLEQCGMLTSIIEKVEQFIKRRWSVIASATLASTAINICTGDQALSVILSSRMFKDLFEHHDLDLKNLSRCTSDGGVVTSPIVPWNVCGVFVASTLGVSTLSYLPYSFFNLISPLMSIVFGVLGIKILTKKRKEDSNENNK